MKNENEVEASEPSTYKAPPPVPAPPPPSLPAPAPSLALKFRAKIVTNISQPGYEGGNVLTRVVADCSEGPARQRMRTTYGNFHTVLVDCAAAVDVCTSPGPGGSTRHRDG